MFLKTAKFRKLRKWQPFEFKISIFLVFFVIWVIKEKWKKTPDFEIRGSCDKGRSGEELLQISSQSVN